jgi:16S rRNA (cytosine1402-N4)-methyltransferase
LKHIPVLLDKVLEALGDIRGKTIVDGTFGAGGYSRAFLERGANVVAFDRDPNVANDANALGAAFPDTFKFVLAPFSKISEMICIKPDAVVFDLGISSMQIDQGERGFSFRFDGPLDMRMESGGMTALELIEQSSATQLARILRDYGDVKKANVLANAFKNALPKTTFELKDLIHNPKDIAPVFQALRIAVNDELGQIQSALDSVPAMLDKDSMCVCVTFHSLEDRLIKQTFRDWTTAAGDPRLPVIEEAKFKLLKTFTPSDTELEENPRARSAHMRGVIKSY